MPNRKWKMRSGIWTGFLHELPLMEAIGLFARHGWRELELSSEHADILLERGSPSQTGAELKSFAESHGVSFPQGHLWITCNIASENQPSVLDRLREWLDLFMALDIRAAVLHPGAGPKEQEVTPCDVQKRSIRALDALTEHIKGSNLVICLENMKGAEMDSLLPLMNGSPHIGICLDTGHLNLTRGDQCAFIRAAGARLKALHITDNDGSFDQHLMPFGHGNVDWSAVLRALAEVEYQGLFNLEIPGERRCPLPVRIAKLECYHQMLKCMEQSVAEGV